MRRESGERGGRERRGSEGGEVEMREQDLPLGCCCSATGRYCSTEKGKGGREGGRERGGMSEGGRKRKKGFRDERPHLPVVVVVVVVVAVGVLPLAVIVPLGEGKEGGGREGGREGGHE